MKLIAGVDEVGRGSLIGPVYAAAVILKKSVDPKILKDSKVLSKKKREYLFNYIKKNSIWSLGKASVSEIEKLNILNASLLAMKRAILKLTKKPTDRRAILEEAAGISGLHVRRHEAELRLGAAENNLKRADELRRQQEKQLANLQKQAEEATKYCKTKCDKNYIVKKESTFS